MLTVSQVKQRYSYSLILLKQLVKTDFKLRYQGSVLGYIWSLLRPLMLFIILYLVFTVFLPVGKDIPNYPVYLLVGIVLWNYFNEVTTGSIGAIVGKGDLIRKINFPKYVIIFAGSLAALINLGLNAIVVAIFMIIGHVHVGLGVFLVIPLVVELFFLAIGVAFLLSGLFVKFRDITYIWEVAMQFGFYATPILYSLTQINDAHHKVAALLILNPMAQIIQDSRRALVTSHAASIGQIYNGNWGMWLVPIGLVAVLFITGAAYFRARSKYFAEEV
jgi:ABC-2 type transport system permease protein